MTSAARLLLRLWLAVPGSRPLPRSYKLLFGNIEAGAQRVTGRHAVAGAQAHR